MMGKRLVPLVFGLVLALLLARPVSAHANLVKSDPPAGALLQAAPKEIVLEFSEALDPSFSRVQLYNSKNQVVNPGPGTIGLAASTIMRLTLGDLPKDSYTALWRSRSAADGHITEGSVPFGIGVAATTTSLIPALGTPDPATEVPPPLDAATRTLDLLMLAVAFGGLPFALLVWRPAVRRAQLSGATLTVADTAITATIRRLVLIGSALFVLTNVAFLITQAADAAGVPLAQALGAPTLALLAGRLGELILARLGLTVLLAILAWRLPLAGQGAAWLWWLALALLGAVVLTFSLSAHAAAETTNVGLAIALDWLHVAAMVAWLGGLIPLISAIRAARRDPEQAMPLAILIPRFSWLAFPCVVVLTLSGLYSYLLHINALDLLAATTYGRALLVKLAVFGVLIVLGALNLVILSRRLRGSGNQLARAFGRTVRTELVLGLVVLLAVGVMTSVAPSTTAWEAHERLGLTQAAKENNVDLTLRVAPAQVGDNEWAVDVTDNRPGAQAAPAKVILRFGMLGMEMEPLQIDTATHDKQRYTARGSYTSMGGRWNVEVVLRRAGFDDVTHTFELDIVRSPEAALAP
jgi:copper transport protein